MFNTPDDIKSFADVDSFKSKIEVYWITSNSSKNSPSFEWTQVKQNLSELSKQKRERWNSMTEKEQEEWKSEFAKFNGMKGGILRRYRRQAKLFYIEELIKSNQLQHITFSLVQFISRKLDGKEFERSTWKKIQADYGFKENRKKFSDSLSEEQMGLWSILRMEYITEEVSERRREFLIERLYDKLNHDLSSKDVKKQLKQGKVPKI